ncbi:hypothetical protein BD410DRAFT_845327 [Rickenella mellea]|uniref:Uncharacterized protein n=1 Tax=Rickenella mellea TaxID=50990 RepID=A0A4Y7PJP5_9AGAM|nr:hypothetical protein BD410DRAFT_845327 [Rickenella mellea]
MHDGADFLDHFKKTLPDFLDNPITFYDDISISLRGRLLKAVRPSEYAEPMPALGTTVTIPYLTYLVDTIIEYHRGSELVSNFSWRCSDYILIVDVIPTALLCRYLDDPKAAAEGNIFTKYSNSSDDIEEFDDDELSELKPTKYSNSSDNIEEFDNMEMPELKSSFEIDEIENKIR